MWRLRRASTPGKVTQASSVIERRGSATPRNQIVGLRPLLIGGLSIAVVLLGWLIYVMTHMATYTVDSADLKVRHNGGLIIRHVGPPYSAVQVPAMRLALSKGRT